MHLMLILRLPSKGTTFYVFLELIYSISCTTHQKPFEFGEVKHLGIEFLSLANFMIFLGFEGMRQVSLKDKYKQ